MIVEDENGNDIYLSDLDDDREPDSPDDPPYEPVDPEHIRVAMGFTPGAATGESVRQILDAVPDMLAEIEDLRAQVARWHGLERAQQYAVTTGLEPGAPYTAVWRFDTPDAAFARLRRGEQPGPEGRVWVRPVAYHPWTELVTESPF